MGVSLGTTVDFKFTTRAGNPPVPFALAGSPAVSAYRNNSTTQITAGITLTTPFDSVTGLTHVRAVLSEGNGYASGDEIDFVLTSGTVDGNSVVGEVLHHEQIEKTDAYSAAQSVLEIVDAPDIGNRQIMEKLLYGVAANIVNDKGNYSLSTDTILSFWETLTTDGDDVTNSFGKVLVDAVAAIAALPTATDIRDAVFARPFHSKMGSFTYEEVAAFTLIAVSAKLNGADTSTSTFRNIADNANAIVMGTDASGRATVSYTIGAVHA